jgi:hypothetical protein
MLKRVALSLACLLGFAASAQSQDMEGDRGDQHRHERDRHERHAYNIDSVAGILTLPGNGPTPGADAARTSTVSLNPTTPAKSRLIVTPKGSEFSLSGISLSTQACCLAPEGVVGYTGSFTAPTAPSQVTAQTNLSFASFGTWQTTSPSTPQGPLATTYGAYAAGIRATDIPRNGTATYNGAAYGELSGHFGSFVPLAAFFSLSGTSRVDVNFTTSRVAANINLPTSAPNGPGSCGSCRFSVMLSGTGSLSKDLYTMPLSGSVSGSVPNGVIPASGNAVGKLYGPGAPQTAGTFSATAPVGLTQITGAFGGKR